MDKYFKLVSTTPSGKQEVWDMVSCGSEDTAIMHFSSEYDLSDTSLSIEEASQSEFNKFVQNLSQKDQDFNPEDYEGGYSEWFLIDTKRVLDFDGFWTEYSLWYNEFTDRFVCIFGDTDIYYPENADYDMEFEDEDEAREWFDSYEGAEDEDIESAETIQSEDNIHGRDFDFSIKFLSDKLLTIMNAIGTMEDDYFFDDQSSEIKKAMVVVTSCYPLIEKCYNRIQKLID